MTFKVAEALVLTERPKSFFSFYWRSLFPFVRNTYINS